MKQRIVGSCGEVVFTDKSKIVAIEYGIGDVDDFDFDKGDVKTKAKVCKIHLSNGTSIQVCTNLTPNQVGKAISIFGTCGVLALNKYDYEVSLKREPLEAQQIGNICSLYDDFGMTYKEIEQKNKDIDKTAEELKKLKYSYERFE